MATYYVQPINDTQGWSGAWEVAKKHGQGTTRVSDHRKKNAAIRNARRTANKGDSIGVKYGGGGARHGRFQKWIKPK